MVESKNDEILKKICFIILHHPGIHLSKIAELCNQNVSTVEVMLAFLEEQGVLWVNSEVGYKQYYYNVEKTKYPYQKKTQEIRKQIYDLILQNPGLHLSKIAKILKMNTQLTAYYLNSMEKDRELVGMKGLKGYFKRYYVVDAELDTKNQMILEMLRKKIPLQIVLLLLKNRYLTHKDILEHVSVSSSTLSYHLSQLTDHFIIAVTLHESKKKYHLVNPKEILHVLKQFELHIEYQLLLDSFEDVWKDFTY